MKCNSIHRWNNLQWGVKGNKRVLLLTVLMLGWNWCCMHIQTASGAEQKTICTRKTFLWKNRKTSKPTSFSREADRGWKKKVWPRCTKSVPLSHLQGGHKHTGWLDVNVCNSDMFMCHFLSFSSSRRCFSMCLMHLWHWADLQLTLWRSSKE